MSTIIVTNPTSVVRVTSAGTPTVQVTGYTTPTVKVSSVGIQGPRGAAVAELCLAILAVTPTNVRVARYTASNSITFDPVNALATCGVVATATTTFPIKNSAGVVIGGITYAANATTGTVTLTAPTLARGDVLDIFAPSASNGIVDVSITIPATRNL